MDESQWSEGISSELVFWDGWLASRGNGSEEFRFRLDPDAELQEDIKCILYMVMHGKKNRVARILDVGAGPLTWLGKRYNGVPVVILAVDALARPFKDLLKKHGIIPPVLTQHCKSEDISGLNLFKFDLITARNTLDHSQNPMKVIMDMPGLLIPGGMIYLEHIINEGECSQYEGFHQWNFNLVDDHLILSSRDERFDVTEMFLQAYPGSTMQHLFTIPHEIITIITLP